MRLTAIKTAELTIRFKRSNNYIINSFYIGHTLPILFYYFIENYNTNEQI